MVGAGTTNFNGGLSISTGANNRLFSRTLVNNLDTLWTSGGITAADNGIFINSPGAFFEINQLSPYSVVLSGTQQAVIINNGVLESYGAAISVQIYVPYINNNATIASGGRLYFLGGTTSVNGTYLAKTGAVLAFGGVNEIQQHAKISSDSASTIEFTTGTTDLYCVYDNQGKTYVSGGYVTFYVGGQVIDVDKYVHQDALLFTGFAYLEVVGGTLDLHKRNLTLPTMLLSGGSIVGDGTWTIQNATWSAGKTPLFSFSYPAIRTKLCIMELLTHTHTHIMIFRHYGWLWYHHYCRFSSIYRNVL